MCVRARVRGGVEGIGERERVKQAGDEGRDEEHRCARWAGCVAGMSGQP